MIDLALEFEIRIVPREHNVTLYKHRQQVARAFLLDTE
jgi:hypothetical protein